MRIIVRLIVTISIILGTLALASPAEAAGCVSRKEFRAIAAGMSPAQVSRRVGATGRILASHYDSYQGDYSYQTPDGEWVDVTKTEYYNDRVIVYRACSGGRVGVQFDTYTFSDTLNPNRYQAVEKSRTPRYLIWW